MAIKTAYEAQQREGQRGKYWVILKTTVCEHGVLSRDIQATVLVWDKEIVDDVVNVLNTRANAERE